MENLLGTILEILAENGETRTVTLLRLTDQRRAKFRLPRGEPMVFEIYTEWDFILELPFHCDMEKLRIDWGDGSLTGLRHNYLKAGNYRVKIYNTDPNNNPIWTDIAKGWADLITNFISLGRINLKTLKFMFYGTHFNGIIGPNWDTSKITSLAFMFTSNSDFNRKFGHNWDTGSVTDMQYMFDYATRFNQSFGFYPSKKGDHVAWDTHNVVSLKRLLSVATSFNQPFGFTEGVWDLSNVVDMSHMFDMAHSFNQPFNPNGIWNTHKLENLSFMFYSANKFNQPFDPEGKWDISQVTNMERMFSASSFNQKNGLSEGKWDTGNVQIMDYMFQYARKYNQKIEFSFGKSEGKCDISNVVSMKLMFDHADSYTHQTKVYLN